MPDVMTASAKRTSAPQGQLVEMSWDPITRIVGSLGIYTKIDFDSKKVVECYSTSSIFRGYSIFMKNKDPRDAHFITSRICGICGDNHATCSVYAQNMAYRHQAADARRDGSSIWAKRPSTCSITTFSRTIWSASISASMMVKETNPGVWDKAQTHASAARGRSRLSHDRRHHEGAESVRRANSTARRCR